MIPSASEVSTASVNEFMFVCSMLAAGRIRLPAARGRALGLIMGGEPRSVTTYNAWLAYYLLRKAYRSYRGEDRAALAEALEFMNEVRAALYAPNASALKKIAKPSALALRIARCAFYGEGRSQAKRIRSRMGSKSKRG